MKLISYKYEKGNFGDDLNDYLWSKIFGDNFFNSKKDIALFGIGSILTENSEFLKQASSFNRKLVIGTGVRSIKETFNFDNTWDFQFLRGPFSSYKTTGSFDKYISDSAYFYTLLPEYKKIKETPKKHKISIIPYFRSVDLIQWKKLCSENGFHLITPTNISVREFIKQVAESEYIFSEAMHGAIMADIMRVPWQRLKLHAHIHEGDVVSEFKWNDWLASINIQNINSINLNYRNKDVTNLNYFKKKKWIHRTSQNFNKIIEHTNFNLSTTERFNQIVKELKESQKAIKSKYDDV